MVDMAIDRDVTSEVTLVHQPTAKVRLDLVNVSRIDGAVGIHVTDSQCHGARCIHRTGGTVYTRDVNGDVGTVATSRGHVRRRGHAPGNEGAGITFGDALANFPDRADDIGARQV